jgi:hypothetical protein
MLITLKQAEIEQALKQFIASRGIAVAGKTITIEFTSGRKNNGLSAEVDIEGDEPAAAAIGTVTGPITTGLVLPSTAPLSLVIGSGSAGVVEASSAVEPVAAAEPVAEAAAPAPAPAVSSLFGG